MSRYEFRNRAAILNTMEKFGDAWWLLCDSFVGMGADAQRPLEVGERDRDRGTRHVHVAVARPRRAERGGPERQCFEVSLHS